MLGLLARRRKIIVIRDACGYWYDSEAELAFRQMSAKGAILATTEELLSGEAEAKINQNRKPSAENKDMINCSSTKTRYGNKRIVGA